MDAYDIAPLHIAGYDAPVPNEYWRTGSDTLLVLLLGLGYTNDMPLMFYVQELAMRRRWDVLRVNYDYRGLKCTTQEQRVARMAADCRATLDAALAEGKYSNVVLAGKSLGTIAMTTLLRDGMGPHVTTLWLTPICKWPEVREAMTAVAATSVVVIGTCDDHYDPGFLGGLEAMGAMVNVVDGGDHSLDIEGDVLGSIGVMRDVIRKLDGFLERAVG